MKWFLLFFGALILAGALFLYFGANTVADWGPTNASFKFFTQNPDSLKSAAIGGFAVAGAFILTSILRIVKGWRSTS